MSKLPGVWVTSVIGVAVSALLVLLGAQSGQPATAQKPGKAASANDYTGTVRPLIKRYCLECHSRQAKRGSLDLERFAALNDVRKDLKPWQGVIEHLEVGDMPPRGMPQPTAGEKQQILAWVRGFLAAEGRARSGDPGYVPLRRLSNAEYNYTIRDLTGVDLQPTREFPADGAAGEGFTNAAEALTEVSPTLLNKYLNAAKDIADHAVLLPNGFRLSPTKTRRDWTDESTARLRDFFTAFATPEGKLPFPAYLAATVRYRDAIMSNRIKMDVVGTKERLNQKYLKILWGTLTDKTPSYPLDEIRAHWRQAEEKDIPALTAEIAAWQNLLWKVVRVGSYMQPVGNGYAESTSRQAASDPVSVESQPIRLAVKPAPGQSEVRLYLATRELTPGGAGQVVWHSPRFEAPGKPPLLLRDYAQFGPRYETDYPAVFADSTRYLAAAVEAANHRSLSVEALAQQQGLDAAFLKRWIEVLNVAPLDEKQAPNQGRRVPAVALEPLEEKIPQVNKPTIRGWRKKGAELPSLVTNASDTVEYIPGKASPHGVMVHPTPTEFVAVAWKSPVEGQVRIRARIAHAHPACGNGVAWWLEHRRGERAMMFAEGALALGGEANPPLRTLQMEKGDLILLAVDAKSRDHVCDLTEISLHITQAEGSGRIWDLAGDIADKVLEGNPHADRYGGREVWSFVMGPSRAVAEAAEPLLPPSSVLGRWHEAVSDPGRQADAAQLAEQAQRLLSGPRPAKEKDPDCLLYDHLVSVESPLFQGVDLARLAKPKPGGAAFGLPRERFIRHPGGRQDEDASLLAAANTVTEVRLPAALFQGREFVVEGTLGAPAGDRAVLFQVLTTPPVLSKSEAAPPPDLQLRISPPNPRFRGNMPVSTNQTPPGLGAGGRIPEIRWDGRSQVVASPTGAAYKRLLQGHDDFRRCFPLFTCFPQVIPNDEVVSLKMFHREDEPLRRLFLNIKLTQRLDRLWTEHRFISRQPVAENKYLPLFIGFVTQDQPKEMVAYFEGQRPAFRARSDAFEKEEQEAIPKQLGALLDFTSRAYRRTLQAKEQTELRGLYQSLRARGMAHEEAFRGVLAQILVSPAFLFRIEQSPPGKEPGAVNDWELATRLSYFLWASAPDSELRQLAAKGKLHDPAVLAAQTRRMLKDDRIRALAVEFGAQWIHVRGFDELKEKNEKLFPTFDANLRQAIYEETILFFEDLFQADRPVTNLLDTDYTYLNETLAKHYGIPGVAGTEWRRVGGVRKYGRGGMLGLASVQAKESGASRTSPVLRGNWVVETLLGEKLPRPPANVPKLPEEESGEGLTLRQQVERHAKVPECAVCHQRIDPFGFALEKYDPIGRFREKDLGGRMVDAKAALKDGTRFEGIEGLRTYLLTRKKDVVVRLFCRRLLGYALGRAVTPSDQPLLDSMTAGVNKNDGRLSTAVQEIVQSPQFRMIRGRDFTGSK